MAAIEHTVQVITNVYDLVGVFICPSTFLKNKFIEYRFQSEKLILLNNFINVDRDCEDGTFGDYLLYVGRLSEEKGLKTLIDAVIKLNSCSLKIVGDGPLNEELILYAKRTNSTSRIEFLGHKKHEEVIEILKNCGLVVKKGSKTLPMISAGIPAPVSCTVRRMLPPGSRSGRVVMEMLPPSGVKDGVAEAVKHNPDLKKVIILTEKISASDARIIRAICQTNGIDVFGGNCLGVADAWNQVRIGEALGGNKPDESLVKGSIALFSNSGNFTTTMAVYLLTKGWGTTTSVSSGKDVYIHYGPKEFFHALDNDDRSKGAIILCPVPGPGRPCHC